MSKSKVPQMLRTSLAALALLGGVGGGTYVATEVRQEALRNKYAQAVAADQGTSQAVKVAMVMGHFYESSNRHIGTPYVDKVGKGQPLTVCNGITGPGVVASRYYTPADCYRMEKTRYIKAEAAAQKLLPRWPTYDPYTQATFVDFIWNKGEAAFTGSTMRRKANAGDLTGACRENPRWNKGTVNGVSKVLPGLAIRGDSNDEICREWRVNP
ncbi:endolysin [Comamonas serinivorans]|uniref:Lysozyme n=1 Tax=Comamonas serinivorans TaxID=1082851 RepID=A0A1Y0ET39_9BURK|nr:glycoside hydrolase family protein [Comamonas serinivorans]ARU06746.1 endolysin [Comamonas serinivorans]